MKLTYIPKFHFATLDQAQNILTTRDEFISHLSYFDRMARMQSPDRVEEAEFLNFLRQTALPWQKQEVAAVEQALQKVFSLLPLAPIHLPEDILLIKTNGKEEGNGTYTRGNAIIFPPFRVSPAYEQTRRADQSPLHELILHELFHIFSRYNMTMRNQLYSIIGYHSCPEIPIPSAIRDRCITNPDSPHNTHFIQLSHHGESLLAAPLLYAYQEYNPAHKLSFFEYLRFDFLQVAEFNGQMVPVEKDHQPVLISIDEMVGFYEQAGKNTTEIEQPEEILAANYTLLFNHREELPSPQIPERIHEMIKQWT